MKKKLMIVATLPPPVHGSNVMSQYVVESPKLRESFEVKVLPIRYASSINDIGSFRLGKFKALVDSLFKLVFVLSTFRPSLVYFVPAVRGTSFYRDCLHAAILKLLRQNIVIHLHGKGIRQASAKLFDRLLYKWFFRRTHIIQLSPLLFDDIKMVARREQVYFLPNGIKSEFCDYTTNTKAVLKEDVLNFLFLSNMVVTKGPLVLLDACAILKKNGCKFRVNFVGAETPDVSALRFGSLIDSYGLKGYVSYCGPKYGKEKTEILDASDILILPTSNDCFPIIIIEAMEHGLPVISTYEGAIPEIVIHNKTGLLVEQENVQALADIMEKLINEPDRCINFGLKARERFLEFYTLDNFVDNLLMVFDQILAK